MQIFSDIAELVTMQGAARKSGRRVQEGDLSIIKQAALVVQNGVITWIGSSKKIPPQYKKKVKIESLRGRNVFPAFLECHTHLVFAGDRANEYEKRNQGVIAEYLVNGNVQGSLVPFALGPLYVAQNVIWKNAVGVNASTNNLTKSAPVAWGNSGASSAQAIPSGDGYVEFTTSEINTFKMASLNSGDIDNNYTSLNFAIYSYNNSVYIFENGQNMTPQTVGTHIAGDVFRIAVNGGVVRYFQNGYLIYVSKKTPLYPLLFDTALYSANSTIVNAKIASVVPLITVAPISVQNVVWQNLFGMSATVNNLIKTAPSAWGNSSANSAQSIVSGDGYIEFTAANDPSLYKFAGLTSRTGMTYAEVDFGLDLAIDGLVYIYEKGTQRGTSYGSYIAGDVFRVSVNSNTVRYYKNGVLLYTSAQAPTYPLFLAGQMYSSGAGILNAKIASVAPFGANPAVAVQNVIWQNPKGVTVSGNSLTKSASDGWVNGGASSTVAIPSGDGYVEFTAGETNTYRMAGLSHSDLSQDYNELNYAIYTYIGGALYIFENGQNMTPNTVGTYATGDVFRITVNSNVVRYFKNGNLLYTSARAPVYPLLLDTSLYSVNSTITNAKIASKVPLVTSPIVTAQNVIWQKAVGVAVSGNNISKTAVDGWVNGGASSVQNIFSGDGYIEFTANDTTSYRMAALSHTDLNQDYNELNYAIYTYLGGALYIFENGQNMTPNTIGTYTAGDVFRITVSSNVVRYYKNGNLIYTSLKVPAYPLMLDTSLYSVGSAVTNAKIATAP